VLRRKDNRNKSVRWLSAALFISGAAFAAEGAAVNWKNADGGNCSQIVDVK